MAIISKGIELSYKAGTATEYTALSDLQEIPELNGDKEAIEITTLADEAHKYTDGIANYGDSLTFKFLYDATQFETLMGLDGAVDWKVTLPDESACTFKGTCNVKLDGVGVNAVLTYSLSIRPQSAMAWA